VLCNYVIVFLLDSGILPTVIQPTTPYYTTSTDLLNTEMTTTHWTQ